MQFYLLFSSRDIYSLKLRIMIAWMICRMSGVVPDCSRVPVEMYRTVERPSLHSRATDCVKYRTGGMIPSPQVVHSRSERSEASCAERCGASLWWEGWCPECIVVCLFVCGHPVHISNCTERSLIIFFKRCIKLDR